MEIKEKQKSILIGKVTIFKSDLIRALSWLDFIPETCIDSEDLKARDTILKLVTHIARND